MSGLASPQRCSECGVSLASRKTLVFHLRQVHLTSHSYYCDTCDGAFNNAPALAMHKSNVHCVKSVFCKHCSYSTVSQACMKLYVRSHISGLKYAHCVKQFPNPASLKQHQLHHSHRQVFECLDCDKVFATTHSLNIHNKGKHGLGYLCQCWPGL